MKALVTGGNGFLGTAIVRLLLEQRYEVRSFHRSDSEYLRQLGVETVLGDLADKASVNAAVAGCDIVFHVAAKAGIWGDYRDYYACNVTGTENVIQACRANQVSRLVYTSTPSVVFDGTDEENITEAAPYPEQYFNAYQETKAIAEQAVLAANDLSLATVALRPHLIWGENDPHLVPRVINRAQAGKLKLVGNQQNRVDTTYVDNAALAHIQAAEKLDIHSVCAGKAYFISNDEPMPMKDLLNRILQAAKLPPVTSTIPASLAYCAGGVFEFVYTLLGKQEEPVMTRFLARQLSTAHWFDLSAAKNDFAYDPQVSIEEGMQRLETWLASQMSS